jgi:hypothetical protein
MGGTAALKDALRPATTPFRKVGFAPQTDYSAYGLETIVIPTYYVLGEWHGTIIFNKFDPSGSYLGQYVADVVITSDSTMTFVDVSFEVSFEGDNAYLEYGDPSAYGDIGGPS